MLSLSAASPTVAWLKAFKAAKNALITCTQALCVLQIIEQNEQRANYWEQSIIIVCEHCGEHWSVVPARVGA